MLSGSGQASGLLGVGAEPRAEEAELGWTGGALAEGDGGALCVPAIGECVKAKKEEFDRRKATMGEDEIPDMSDWARPVSQITKAHLD